MATRHGFESLFISGAGVAATLGLKDGMTTMTEARDRARVIVRAGDVPVIADAEEGFGDLKHLERTVREFEDVGIAGLVFEDAPMAAGAPRMKISHVLVYRGADSVAGHAEATTDGPLLFSTAEMQGRIAAAVAARENPDTVIIARTEAMPLEGLDAALARGNAYAEAGADLVFVQQPANAQEVAAMAKGLNSRVLMVNMTLLGPTGITTAELEDLGVKVAIYAGMATRIAWEMLNRAYGHLAKHGTFGSMLKDFEMPRSEYQEIVDW